MIQAKVVAHSKNALTQKEIVSVVVTMPRIILSELNTHRVFSRNSASSRAIPFKRMLKLVMSNPFIPIAWQKDHKGMQGSQYFTKVYWLRFLWLMARDFAVIVAWLLSKAGVTKQLCNRLLEPFMWHTVLITTTELDNFFDLRCPQYTNAYGEAFCSQEDYIDGTSEADMFPSTNLGWLSINKGQAEIHMMAVAEAIHEAVKNSTPKELQPGEWHIPFNDNYDEEWIYEEGFTAALLWGPVIDMKEIRNNIRLQIATARCARISYLTFEGQSNHKKDTELYESLRRSKHASPFEHCAKAMGEKDLDNYMVMEDGVVKTGWCRNFKDFIQYRSLVKL